jgi:hypothetical protein
MYLGLIYLARRAGYKSKLMTAVLVVLLAQLAAAIFAAIATDIRSISPVACLGGLYGLMGSAVACIFVACVLFPLARSWPRDDDNNRIHFFKWMGLWLVFSCFCILVQLRSVTLCTV